MGGTTGGRKDRRKASVSETYASEDWKRPGDLHGTTLALWDDSACRNEHSAFTNLEGPEPPVG